MRRFSSFAPKCTQPIKILRLMLAMHLFFDEIIHDSNKNQHAFTPYIWTGLWPENITLHICKTNQLQEVWSTSTSPEKKTKTGFWTENGPPAFLSWVITPPQLEVDPHKDNCKPTVVVQRGSHCMIYRSERDIFVDTKSQRIKCFKFGWLSAHLRVLPATSLKKRGRTV